MVDSLIDGVYGFQVFFIPSGFFNEQDWSKENGDASRNQSHPLLSIQQQCRWLAESQYLIPITPVEQIQSATVKFNQPVNTVQPLDGADYHFILLALD